MNYSSSFHFLRRYRLAALVGTAWLALVGSGLGWMWEYASTPGLMQAVPVHWEKSSTIQRTEGVPTLLVFAHPRCPCTRATITELAVLMAKCRGRMQAQVWFYRPTGLADTWAETDLWQSAAAIPGVSVACDADGAEAKRFHATVSGQVLLYDAAGRCRYSGGITSARGHAGDNAGRAAVLALLRDPALSNVTLPVFGCTLFDEKTASL